MSKKDHSNKYSIAGIDKVINPVISFFFYYRLVLILFCLATVGYFMKITYDASPDADKVRNAISVLTGGSIIIGIFFSMLNYEYNHNKTKRDVRVAKEILSFNTAFEWHKAANVENLKITKKFYDQHKRYLDAGKPKKFFYALENDETARSALVSIFNYFETIALGIDQGIMDADFMKKYYKPLFIDYYFLYEPYISFRRTLHRSPDDWIYFTTLVENWRKECS